MMHMSSGGSLRSIVAASSAIAVLTASILGIGVASAGESFASSASTSATRTVADASAIGEPSSGKKNEVVYVKTASDGAAQGIYVVNVFDANAATDIDDPSDYTNVTNLTTDQKLQQKDGHVSLTTTADQPFYYQGDMAADTTLPWTIAITYTLDGTTIDPDDLAGRNGDLDIALAINANDDDTVKDFSESYVLQAQGTFPQNAYDITDSDATLATSGSDTVVSAMVLPGESQTFHIHGTAKDFQYSGWQIAGMNLDLAIDLSSQDTSKLTEQTSKLEDATTQLADGSSQLADGSATLASGANTLDQGLAALHNGASSVNTGASQLADGTGSLAVGAQGVQQGATSLAQGTQTLASGSQQLANGVNALTTGVGAVSAAVPQLTSGANTLAHQLGESSNDPSQPTLKDGWQNLHSGIGALSTGSSQYQTTLKQNQQTAETAAQQAAQQAAAAQQQMQTALQSYVADPQNADKQAALNQAIEAFAKANQTAGAYTGSAQALQQASDGYAQLGDGIDSLNTGAATLNNQFDATQSSTVAGGAAQLANGMNQVAQGLNAMPSDSLDALNTAAKQVADGSAAVNTGASELASGSGTLATGASTLHSGASTLAQGTSELAAGTQTAKSGAGQLAEGAQTAASGTRTLAEGNAALAESVSGIDRKVLDELQKTVDDKLGAGFTPHSFVAPGNTNVDRVQFTYVVSGVDKPETDDNANGTAAAKDAVSTADDKASQEGIIARVKALFGL